VHPRKPYCKEMGIRNLRKKRKRDTREILLIVFKDMMCEKNYTCTIYSKVKWD
jgi:hypothetical protein